MSSIAERVLAALTGPYGWIDPLIEVPPNDDATRACGDGMVRDTGTMLLAIAQLLSIPATC